MKLKHLFIASLSFALLGATSEAVFAAKPARKKAKTTKTTKPKKTKTPKEEQITELIIIDDYELYDDGETAAGSSDNIIDAKSVDKEVLIDRPAPRTNDPDKVFDSVEQEPVFPGGQSALLQYVASNIKYPVIAQENGIQGRVVVQFVVTKTGSIGQVKVVRGKDPELDKEAVRVIKTLPPFATPGMMNGQPVNCWYTFPITFRLQRDTPEDSSVDIIDAGRVQTEIPIEPPAPAPYPAPVDDNKVFDSVEQDPVFPGGQAALLQYVASHIKYPETAQKNGIQGRVIVQFVVKKDGSIGEVKVVRSKDPELDKEAVRVTKALPKFTPGMMNGHAVNVWYILPVSFKIESENKVTDSSQTTP